MRTLGLLFCMVLASEQAQQVRRLPSLPTLAGGMAWMTPGRKRPFRRP